MTEMGSLIGTRDSEGDAWLCGADWKFLQPYNVDLFITTHLSKVAITCGDFYRVAIPMTVLVFPALDRLNCFLGFPKS